ncbi:PilZ domain-containing protein [Gemmatimonadota bacterium]
MPGTEVEKRTAERTPITDAVECLISDDILEAKAVDISSSGLRIDSEEPLVFILKLKVNGDKIERGAKIVWSNSQADGSISYGLEFIGDDFMNY